MGKRTVGARVPFMWCGGPGQRLVGDDLARALRRATCRALGGVRMTDRAARNAMSFAEQLAHACVPLLGDLEAVILHGSLVLGGYVPGKSDVDLLAVVGRPLGDSKRIELQELVLRLWRDAPSGLDWRVVTRKVAANPSRAPAMELYVGLHAGHDPEIESCVEAEPDLTVELSMARLHGRSLVGAAPTQVIGHVPIEWVVAYGDVVLTRWQDLTDDLESAELMVLTACRIWRLAVEETYCTKDEAGRWAIARDPSLTVVADVLKGRSGEQHIRVEPPAIGRLLEHVRREIAPRIGVRGGQQVPKCRE